MNLSIIDQDHFLDENDDDHEQKTTDITINYNQLKTDGHNVNP